MTLTRIGVFHDTALVRPPRRNASNGSFAKDWLLGGMPR